MKHIAWISAVCLLAHLPAGAEDSANKPDTASAPGGRAAEALWGPPAQMQDYIREHGDQPHFASSGHYEPGKAYWEESYTPTPDGYRYEYRYRRPMPVPQQPVQQQGGGHGQPYWEETYTPYPGGYHYRFRRSYGPGRYPAPDRLNAPPGGGFPPPEADSHREDAPVPPPPPQAGEAGIMGIPRHLPAPGTETTPPGAPQNNNRGYGNPYYGGYMPPAWRDPWYMPAPGAAPTEPADSQSAITDQEEETGN